jgi:hypothetical protein
MMTRNAQKKTALNAAHSCAMLLLCALIFATAPSAHAQDITTGLVNHWTLDETSGTTANDSGSSNDNAAMGGGLSGSNSVSGIAGTALNFDGTNDYLDMNTQVINALPMTYAGWIYFDSFTNSAHNPIFLSSYVDASTYCGLQISSWGSGGGTTGGLSVHSGTCAGGGSTNRISINHSPGFQTGQWYHLVVAFNTYNSANVYLNGALLPSSGQTGTGGYIGFSGSPETRIGYPTPAYTAYHDGRMDDIRIYNRALTAADATELYLSTRDSYTCTAPGAPTGAITYNEDQNVMQLCNGTDWAAIGKQKAEDSALVGHWKLDETTGTTAIDSSARGNDGTMIGGLNAATDSVTAVKNNGLSFDGVGDFIATPNSLGSETALTFAGWFKTADWSNGGNPFTSIIAYSKDSGSDGIAGISYQNGGLNAYFFVRNASDVNLNANTSGALPTNEWVHIAGTYDGANIRIYINGVLENSQPQTGLLFNGNNTIAIGSKWNNGTYPTGNVSFPFNGDIDDVRIYDRALSTAEIEDLYITAVGTPGTGDTSTGLVGHWEFNETSGTNVPDVSGSGHNGTLIGGAAWSPTEGPKSDGAIYLDGNNDTVNLGSPSDFDNLGANYTLSVWMKTTMDSTTSNTRILSTYSSPRLSGIQYSANEKGRIDVRDSDNSYRSVVGGPALNDDLWHHIVAVRNGFDFTLYIDGVNVNTVNDPAVSSDAILSSQNWYVGSQSGTSMFLNALIDDVRIYNRSLSENDVETLYNLDAGVFLSGDCSTPIAPKRSIIYNDADNVMQYCNGDDWVAMGPAGDGGSGCTDPVGAAGDMVYNETFNVLQYCEGDEWIATGQPNLVLPTEGLVAHWTLDETSGTTVVDSIGGNDGTMNGGLDASTDSVSGQVNTALNFDGVNDYINAGSDASLQITGDITLSSWVYFNSTAAPEGIVSFSVTGETNNTNGLYALELSSATTFQFVHENVAGTNNIVISQSNSIATGQWLHIVAVRNNTASTVTLYVNGVDVSPSINTFSTPPDGGSSGTLSIGKNAVGPFYLDGDIDDVRIYNRTLSASEVLSLYEATK